MQKILAKVWDITTLVAMVAINLAIVAAVSVFINWAVRQVAW